MALTDKLSAIGNAIREKNGTSDLIPLADMPQAILDIVSGGSGETQVIIPVTTVELVAAEGIPLPDGWVMCNAPVFLTETPSLVDSQTYKLTIDSTTYDMQVANNGGMWLGGNVGLLQGGVDSGDDYVFQLGEFQGSPTLMLFLKGEAGTHTVKLEFNQSEIDNLENLIDESGVLEDTEGSVTEKVELLIDKAEELDAFMSITTANQLFFQATSFPTKAVVNLPNATTMNSAFESWNSDTMPIVEELTVNAPNVPRLYQAFFGNRRVRKVILNLSDKCQNMTNAFYAASNLKEVVINFSTKNITTYYGTFRTPSLQKIVGVLDFSSATPTNINYMFDGCNSLEEVTFAPNTLSLSISLANSSLLTSTSIQSVIDGLATVTTAQTLTLHKNIALTDEQKATINAKGWTLAQ